MLKIIYAMLCAIVLLGGWVAWQFAHGPDGAAGDASLSWYTGIDSLPASQAEAEQAGMPHLIYFYTDWCKFCAQLEEELLDTDEVAEALQDVVMIRINPDANGESWRAWRGFGSRGVPALYVRQPGEADYQRIDAFVGRAGFSPEVLSEDAFITRVLGRRE